MLNNPSDLLFGPVFDTVDIGLVVLDSQGCIVGWMNGWPRFAPAARDVVEKRSCEVIPRCVTPVCRMSSNRLLRVGSSSILTHTLNALLPLQGENDEPLLHNIVVRPVSSVHANYCLLQVTDVTVAVTRERVLRERQNARYHAIVIPLQTRSSRSMITAIFNG